MWPWSIDLRSRPCCCVRVDVVAADAVGQAGPASCSPGALPIHPPQLCRSGRRRWGLCLGPCCACLLLVRFGLLRCTLLPLEHACKIHQTLTFSLLPFCHMAPQATTATSPAPSRSSSTKKICPTTTCTTGRTRNCPNRTVASLHGSTWGSRSSPPRQTLHRVCARGGRGERCEVRRGRGGARKSSGGQCPQ